MGCNGSKTAAAAATAKAPEAVKGDFELTLERKAAEQALGLSVVSVADALTVQALKDEGMVPDFLKSGDVSAEQQLKAGDKIVAVNGVAGNAEQMLKELDQKTVVLSIQRAEAAVAADVPAAGTAAAVQETSAEAQDAAKPEPVDAEAAAAGTDGEAAKATAEEESAAPVATTTTPAEAGAAAEEATSKEPAREAKDTAEVAAPADDAAAASDEKKPAEGSAGLSAMTLAKAQEAAAELREDPVKTLELAELQVEAAPDAQKEALCKLWPVC